MNALKIALLTAVAVLLLVVVIDRMRTPEQLKAVRDEVAQATAAVQRQTLELKAIRQALESRPAGAVAATGTSTPAADAARDGKPKLAANFLLPYDVTHFHPEWLRGTLSQFNSSPKGLNPIIDNSADASAVEGLVNDSLCSQHPAHPELWSENVAASLIISDDYKTYTFTIRPGIRWQRPQIAKTPGFEWLDRDVELSSKDFAFYLELGMHPDVESPHLKAYLEDLDRWETPDDRTLVLRWKKKVYTSLSTSMSLNPLPRHVYGRDRRGGEIPAARLGVEFNKHWFDEERQYIGVGAYFLERWDPDKTIAFRRDASYWGAGLHFERIAWDGEVKLPDPQLVAFKNGQAHTYVMAPQQYKSEILDGHEPRFAKLDAANPKAGRGGELGWERVRSSSYSYVGWNMRKPLFADKRVRQALSYAFPQQRIIDEVYHGLGRPQITNVHPDSPYYHKALPQYAYDVAKAKALLAEAGWSDTDADGWLDRDIGGVRTPFRFVVKYYANAPPWDSTFLIYKNELRALGIDMTPTPYEWKEMLRIYEDKDFDAISGGWQFGLDVDFYQLWHSKYANEPRSSNHCGFVNARADQLAEELRVTFDLDQRVRIAREFQAIIHDEQPYTFFRSSESIFAWQNRGQDGRALHGVTDGLDRYHPLFSRSPLLWHFAAE